MNLSFSQIATLRLGYGPAPHLAPPASPAELMAEIAAAAPDAHALTTQHYRDLESNVRALRMAYKKGAPGGQERFRDSIWQARKDLHRHYANRLGRILEAPAGFGERLVRFWADHFTVRGRQPQLDTLALAMEDEAIRPNLSGRFEDMLIAADTHPMMLIYLDQIKSTGPNSLMAIRRARQVAKRRAEAAPGTPLPPDLPLGLNENLAREMVELHTLGVDADYTQRDVLELAELLTGLNFHINDPNSFIPMRAEPGAETVLGHSYGSETDPARLADIHAVMRDLARHPATGRHITRKLAVHFVADEPPPALLARLAARWQETGGDLGAVTQALVESPELSETFRQKVRQPYEFLAAALRALGLTPDRLAGMNDAELRRWLLEPLRNMGQEWGNPPGPDGWPQEAAAWITPQSLAARIDWATSAPMKLLRPLPDPRDFLITALSGTASEPLSWAVPKSESTVEGIALILASADFNRR